jgi:hypothetical protein
VPAPIRMTCPDTYASAVSRLLPGRTNGPSGLPGPVHFHPGVGDPHGRLGGRCGRARPAFEDPRPQQASRYGRSSQSSPGSSRRPPTRPAPEPPPGCGLPAGPPRRIAGGGAGPGSEPAPVPATGPPRVPSTAARTPAFPFHFTTSGVWPWTVTDLTAGMNDWWRWIVTGAALTPITEPGLGRS